MDHRLQEFNLGSAENIKYNKKASYIQLRKAYDSFFSGSIMPTGADSTYSFRKRIFDSMNDLPNGTSAVFCHSGIHKIFLKYIKYPKEYLGNLSMTLIEFDDIYDQWELVGVFYGYCHED
jgi:broad specificity phosphatase PhoE